MMIHYREGSYIIARGEDGSIPLIRVKNGESLQPVFTDMQEFAKFQHTNTSKKFRTSVMTEGEFLKVVPKEASGVVVNPLGISLVLKINRK